MTDSDVSERRIALIRSALSTALNPESLTVTDESHLHVGHAGAQSGLGHFYVSVVAADFAGRSLIERHRVIYAALGDLMTTDIHALGIDAHAPDEPR